MATPEKVMALIRAQDPQAYVDGIADDGDRITGEFVSDLFEGMSDDQRKEWVDKYIREPLEDDGWRVGILIPLTRSEF